MLHAFTSSSVGMTMYRQRLCPEVVRKQKGENKHQSITNLAVLSTG